MTTISYSVILTEIIFLVSDKNKEHHVTQFHYIGWPDHGAPDSTAPIISLVRDVRAKLVSTKNKNINILVHCSAGVGRTGTFIALYQLMDLLDVLSKENSGLSNTIDIFNTVLQLRSKRIMMVSTSVTII